MRQFSNPAGHAAALPPGIRSAVATSRTPDARLVLSPPNHPLPLQSLLTGPRRLGAWLRNLASDEPQRSAHDEVACYMLAGEEEDAVVCTSAPDEYAWYEGINETDMTKVDPGLLVEGHLACEEGATFRGSPVWQCGKNDGGRRPGPA